MPSNQSDRPQDPPAVPGRIPDRDADPSQDPSASSSIPVTPPSARQAESVAFTRGSWGEWRRIQDIIRKESVGGILLLVATVLALVCANSGLADGYFGIRNTYVGPQIGPVDLHLSIGHWAADGLLAVFFFMAGLELKREFVAGDLRDPRKAVLPVVAAACGVAVPAIFYVLVNLAAGPEALNGWAIPAATDIAFALAVLAVIGSSLPAALRTFLLTLAIVDDLIAILIIAIFYSSDLSLGFLAAAVVPLVVYGLVAQKGDPWFRQRNLPAWLVLLPIGIVCWALLLNSGVHATIAGVALAFTIPVRPTEDGDDDADHGLAHVLEHRVRPLSAGFCVPVFAFFSAGVAIGGWGGFTEAIGQTVTLGIIAGLVLGKIVGIVGGTLLATRFRGINLSPEVNWIDVVGLGALGGIGFTVSLLIGELSFPADSPAHDYAKIGVLMASLLAALLASLVLIPRNRHYRAVSAAEKVDLDADGVPDLFEEDETVR